MIWGVLLGLVAYYLVFIVIFNLVRTSFIVGCLEGVGVFLFQKYTILLAGCVLSLIVLSAFDYDLRLYLGLLACWDVRCHG